MKIKKLLLPLVFCTEVIGACYYFALSDDGLQAINMQKKENRVLAEQIDVLYRDVVALERTTHAWENDPFYVEKIAREELHMARDNELIYFL